MHRRLMTSRCFGRAEWMTRRGRCAVVGDVVTSLQQHEHQYRSFTSSTTMRNNHAASASFCESKTQQEQQKPFVTSSFSPSPSSSSSSVHPLCVAVGDTASLERCYTVKDVLEYRGLFSPTSSSSSLFSSPFESSSVSRDAMGVLSSLLKEVSPCASTTTTTTITDVPPLPTRLPVDGAMLLGLISNVLGTQLPGPQSVYLRQDIQFHRVGLCDDADDGGADTLPFPSPSPPSSSSSSSSSSSPSLLDSAPSVGVFTGECVRVTVTVREFIVKRGIVVLDVRVEKKRQQKQQRHNTKKEEMKWVDEGADASAKKDDVTTHAAAGGDGDAGWITIATGDVVGVNKVITFKGKGGYALTGTKGA